LWISVHFFVAASWPSVSIITQTVAWSLPSTLFQIHFSLITAPLSAVWSEILIISSK
jgi:hypothetical protein